MVATTVLLMLSRTISGQAWRIATRSICKTTATSTTRLSSQAIFVPAAPSSRPLTTSRRLRADTPMASETDSRAEEVQNTTGITPDSLAETLKKAPELNASHVDIQDISGGCGASFAALIVSDAFQGKSALQRHRLVNGILKKEIAAVHAWTPKCLTTEQWEKEKGRMA